MRSVSQARGAMMTRDKKVERGRAHWPKPWRPPPGLRRFQVLLRLLDKRQAETGDEHSEVEPRPGQNPLDGTYSDALHKQAK